MSKQYYTYHDVVGIFISDVDDSAYGTFVFQEDPSIGFRGWSIDERRTIKYPTLKPYLGMRGWIVDLKDLTKVSCNLGGIYE